MSLRIAMCGAFLTAMLAAPPALGAPSITTGDAYSNGSGGTSTSLRATFDVGDDCTGAVSYEIGSQPLSEGGHMTVNSSANYPTGLPGGSSDVTTVRDLVPDTLYYYRALVTTHNCATAGQSASGAQRCMVKKRSINELENTKCPGEQAPAPTQNTGSGPATDEDEGTPATPKPGNNASNRIKLPGKYCDLFSNDSGGTFLFALKVKGVSCKSAEALVDRASKVSGVKKRFRLTPSKALCTAVRNTSGVEYHCKLGARRIFYYGYGGSSLILKKQLWTNLYPKGS